MVSVTLKKQTTSYCGWSVMGCLLDRNGPICFKCYEDKAASVLPDGPGLMVHAGWHSAALMYLMSSLGLKGLVRYATTCDADSAVS